MGSDREAPLAFEVPSPLELVFFPDASSAYLDFFGLVDLVPSSLDESEEEFPLGIGGNAFRRATPTLA